MIKFENFEVVGWDHALRGMRNPKNSWNRGDSDYRCPYRNGGGCGSCAENMCLGPNDYELAMKLAKGGPVHAKYRRMITVYVDITAPLYWWKEFDTYKVGTVANSCSTMHKIHERDLTIDDFSHDKLFTEIDTPHFADGFHPIEILELTIKTINLWRKRYLELKDKPTSIDAVKAKECWEQMIQLLPSSYNQKRTIMLNYEVLANVYRWRRNHKLDEWVELCKWIESLPYSEIITGVMDEKGE